jgi:uncharacterized membrane protein required for colicin V production
LSNFATPRELNTLDLVLILTMLISIIRGYRQGLLQSLFKVTGYILGGLVGIYVALNYLDQFELTLKKLLLTLILILLIAMLLEYISEKVGVLVRRGSLFAPFKLVDSLLGALLALLKNFIIFYLFATIILFSSFKQPVDYIKQSYIHFYLDKYLIKIFIDLNFNFLQSITNSFQLFF